MTKTERLQALIDNAHDEDDDSLRHWQVEYVARAGWQGETGVHITRVGWHISPYECFYPGERIFLGQRYQEAKAELIALVKLFYS